MHRRNSIFALAAGLLLLAGSGNLSGQERYQLLTFSDSLGYMFGNNFVESLVEQRLPVNYRIALGGVQDVFMPEEDRVSSTALVSIAHRATERRNRILERMEEGDTVDNFERAVFGVVSGNDFQTMRTWNDSMSYLLGNEYGSTLKMKHPDLSIGAFTAGMIDAVEGKDPVLTEDGELIVNLMLQGRRQSQKQEQMVDVEKEVSFLRKMSQKEGVTTLPSGLMYEVIDPGTGRVPASDATYVLHTIASFIEGDPFLDTRNSNQPLEMTLDAADPAWVEVLERMPLGATYRLYIPPDIGYARAPSDMPKRVLIYEMTLVEAIEGDFDLDDI